MAILRQAFLAIALITGSLCAAQAEELTVNMTYLSVDRPSPFPAQLLVQVTNEGFMSVPILEKLMASELLVDGHPFKRADVPFNGPDGLAPKGSWEGCVPLDDYVPGGLTPGAHHLLLRIGDMQSKENRIHVEKAEPVATSPDQRRRQVDALRDILSPGLLRGCVENWLPERDGGLSSIDGTRYYVDPGVKVLVSYQQSQPEPRVKGRVKVYLESRMAD
jgi:hypothetical protein